MNYAGAAHRPIAVITGALGGMGRACVNRFATDYRLALLDVDAHRLEEAADEMAMQGVDVVLARACDVADRDQVVEFFQAVAAVGNPAAVVHTSGLSPALADWESIVRVNALGTARVLDAFFPLADSGAVAVCIASVAGYGVAPDEELNSAIVDVTDPGLTARLRPILTGMADANDPYGLAGPAYGVSKYAVQRMVVKRAPQWAARSVRIVSISPGLIYTPMGRKEVTDNERAAGLLQMTPLNRWGSPLDIANAAAFLCSNEASFITGCDLRVDGGAVALMEAQ